jgi:hypothetical protein
MIQTVPQKIKLNTVQNNNLSIKHYSHSTALPLCKYIPCGVFPSALLRCLDVYRHNYFTIVALKSRSLSTWSYRLLPRNRVVSDRDRLELQLSTDYPSEFRTRLANGVLSNSTSFSPGFAVTKLSVTSACPVLSLYSQPTNHCPCF